MLAKYAVLFSEMCSVEASSRKKKRTGLGMFFSALTIEETQNKAKLRRSKKKIYLWDTWWCYTPYQYNVELS